MTVTPLGNDARQGFEDGDLRAERIVYGREFDADRTCADDDQSFRDFRQFQDRAVGQDRFVIGLDARQCPRFRAAHEQNVGGLNLGLLAVFLDADAARPFIAAPTLHPFHFIFFEQELDALGVLFYDFVFARKDIAPIDLQAADLEAQLRAVFEMVVNVGVMEQHFGGDAADVQAGAAEEGIFLDDYGLEAQFAGTDGGHIPARSAADNCHVVLCHAQSPFRRARTCLSANGNQADRTLAADLMKKGRIAMN